MISFELYEHFLTKDIKKYLDLGEELQKLLLPLLQSSEPEALTLWIVNMSYRPSSHFEKTLLGTSMSIT